MSKCKIVLLCLISLGLASSSRGQTAVKIEMRPLAKANSNKHIFQLPYNELKDSLTAFFRDFDKQYDNPYLKQVFSHVYENGHKGQVIFFLNTATQPSLLGYS